MKKVLLTGGTGLVGDAILKEMISKRYVVYLLSRNPPAAEAGRLIPIQCDMRTASASLLEQMPDVDAVVHAGAAVEAPPGADEFELFRTVNMTFSELLFKWADRKGRDIPVVYMSTLSFMQRPLQEIITETHPVAPLSPYSLSKYWAEKALLQYSSHSRFRPVSLRISSPIAFDFERLHDTVVKKWIRKAIAGEQLTVSGSGKRAQDFIAIEDIAMATVACLEIDSARGIYNLGSGSALSMNQLAKMIASKLGGTIAFGEADQNENERWNVSIERAMSDFAYRPRYESSAAIGRLLGSIT
jgi:UDP-glucose 4-epimerase